MKVNPKMLAALTVTEVASHYGGLCKVAHLIDQRTGYRYTLERWRNEDWPEAFRVLSDSWGRTGKAPQSKRIANTLKLALFPEEF